MKWSESWSVVSNPLRLHGLYSSWNSPGQNTRWVAVLFSRGSSQPRDQTQVSCIAGGFFTSWAPREAQSRERRPEYKLIECFHNHTYLKARHPDLNFANKYHYSLGFFRKILSSFYRLKLHPSPSLEHLDGPWLVFHFLYCCKFALDSFLVYLFKGHFWLQLK